MEIKVLAVALSFLSCSAIADVKTIASDAHENSEVTVQNIGDTACVFNYKNSDYLTTEGMPVFYTFQVELKEGELQEGMQSWLPYGIKPGEPSTLAFYDKKIGKIYEYTYKVSSYGELFYQTDLFTHFLNVDKIQMRQGGVTIDMPVYSNSGISSKTIKAFQSCVNDLNGALKTYCKSSTDASKQCLAKKSNAKKASVNEVIKDDPDFIAAAKLKELEKSKGSESISTPVVSQDGQDKKAFEDAVALEVAKALKQARIKALAREAKQAAEEKNKKKISIFIDNPEGPYQLNRYGKHSAANVKISNGGLRGNIMRISYLGNKDVAYFATKNAIDYSEYTYLEFDLKLIADPHPNFNLNIKMDCAGYCSSGPYKIEKPRLGEWKHYKVPLEDLLNNPGSNLNLINVYVPFAVFPDWGSQNGVKLQVDSITLSNY
ncbi:hypothetical protein [Psychromonas sp. MME2]|uniref:hypothetical protein n=1 Tax=unclassified Psychromonas TaxID=2614957 RepID=UPI00339C1409